MAGHNKWSKVKRLKGALDAKRGKVFSRLAKEISVAARMGGSDPASNARLRSAVLAGRAQNMPNDNIERAIKRGAGELDGERFEESIYEGYAPDGVAVMVEVATDNKNRTAADLRLIFTKNHGSFATSGSVAYIFLRKGQITVPAEAISDDRLLEIVFEAGGEELTSDADFHIVLTPPDQLYAVGEALKDAGVAIESQKLFYIPGNTVEVSDEHVASQVLRLCDALDDCDDVQNLYANYEIPEDILAELSA